jgi:hypothetical protein
VTTVLLRTGTPTALRLSGGYCLSQTGPCVAGQTGGSCSLPRCTHFTARLDGRRCPCCLSNLPLLRPRRAPGSVARREVLVRARLGRARQNKVKT